MLVFSFLAHTFVVLVLYSEVLPLLLVAVCLPRRFLHAASLTKEAKKLRLENLALQGTLKVRQRLAVLRPPAGACLDRVAEFGLPWSRLSPPGLVTSSIPWMANALWASTWIGVMLSIGMNLILSDTSL